MTSNDTEELPTAVTSIGAEALSRTAAAVEAGGSFEQGTSGSQSADKAKGKPCGVCNNHEARYKCSRCQLPYCSVACATLHRATHPAVTDDVPPTTVKVEAATNNNGVVTKYMAGTMSASGSPDPFSVLRGARDLQTLFLMYPRLRSHLRNIYTATLPSIDDSTVTFENCEDHPQSYGGRGRGKARSSRGKERGPWNADRGTQDGIDALRTAKQQYGKAGEGVREYAELVLKLVSMEGVDVARLVQEEVAEENAKIIAQLLNGDSF